MLSVFSERTIEEENFKYYYAIQNIYGKIVF